MSTILTGDPVVDRVVGVLARLPGVDAVALGGSRATGTARPDSDWDLAVYYRAGFDPAELTAAGLRGVVSPIGGWGGGVFNGGAWLDEGDRRIDVHYRDLGAVDREIAAAEAGEVRIEPLLFHLAGIPSYLLLAELAVNRVLVGELPRPEYPEALRSAAPEVWRDRAEPELDYAFGHARRGDLTATVGTVAVAAAMTAHALLAAQGEWVTNEKGLLGRAGLGALDGIVRTAAIDGPLPVAMRAAELCRGELGRRLTRR